MGSIKGLSLSNAVGRHSLLGNRSGTCVAPSRLVAVASAPLDPRGRFYRRRFGSHSCSGKGVGGRSCREGTSWGSSSGWSSSSSWEAGDREPRGNPWGGGFSSAWTSDASPADMARQWARLFRTLESRFASRYGEDMINRWNTFLEEFAKEYSEGRETSKPWEAGASSKEGGGRPDKAEAAEAQRGFAVDLEEAADAYFLLADVPGLEKSALSIKLNPAERCITISGTKRRNPRSAPNAASAPLPASDEASQPASDWNDPVQEKTPAYRMFERQVGPFSRSVTLPQDADLDDISARVERGVLYVRIGRELPPPPPEERFVEIL